MDDRDWIECAQPGWRLTFRHPAADSDGQEVHVDRRSQDEAVQGVHITAEDRDEIYFEVVRFAGMAAFEVLAGMRERLPRLYEDVVFTPLEEAAGCLLGSFAWADQERSLRFFELEDATYRVIFRPRGATNRAILETIVVE